MNWAKGYSSSYYMTILDKGTMKDLKRIEITGGSITRTLSDLRESADLECVNYNSREEQIIRVWLDTKQEGEESGHTPLFTGLATSPSDKYNGRLKTNSVQCYSILKIAEDVLLPRGWYAPVDANCGYLIKDLLSVIKTEVHISPNIPKLSQSIIAEEGETHLSMVDKILEATGTWCLRLDGLGEIHIDPIDNEYRNIFDSNDNDVLETEIEITYDWYAAPNVLRCSMDDAYAVARDEDPSSPLSIVNRGREVWLEDSNVQLNAGESLSSYAQRALKEYQRVSTTISYTRRYMPDILPGDIVRLNYPVQGVSGNYLITDQSINLGYSAKTSEEVIKV